VIRVAALTQGRLVPAARFRVRQNIHKLQEIGINVSEYIPAIDVYKGVPFNLHELPRIARLPIVAAWQGMKIAMRIPAVYQTRGYHVTWLQRELLPGYLTLERMFGSPLVFDVDDAVWLTHAGDAARNTSIIAAHASTVLAGNQYIADWFSSFNRNVIVVPTAVDVERFFPLESVEEDEFIIGWIGTKPNLHYLEGISSALRAFFKRVGNAVLLVVSDGCPRLPEVPQNRIRYLPWSEAGEVEAIQKMNVGIMPMPDNEWTRGKCSFKMLQYMACGIPVVVSPVGMNVEVLGMGNVGFGPASQDDWFGALEYLHKNRMAGREMGMRGRDIVINNFSTEVVAKKLSEVFSVFG
jgi:glycosyltransferase involved in cell wall biosynthesis